MDIKRFYKEMATRNLWALFGVLFGFCFPLCSLIMHFLTTKNASVGSYFLDLSFDQMLIATAPFVLGVIAGVVGVQKEKLKDHSTEMDHIFDTIPDMMILFDRDNNIILVNKNADRLMGKKGIPLLGLSFGDFMSIFSVDSYENGEKISINHFNDLKDKDLEAQIEICPGVILNVLISTSEIHSNSNILKYRFLILKDISKLKVYQERDEAKQQVIHNSKMAALGAMAGGIAHEINNPISIIDGRAHQIIKMCEQPEPDSTQVNKLLGDIRKNVVRVSKIIKGLSTFARDSSHDPLVGVSFESLLYETLSYCQEKIKVNNVDLIVGDVPNLELECRPGEISQVLLNLLNNAIDAVSELPEKWVRLTFVAMEDEIKISIIDSGHGIDKDIQKKILTPFFTTKKIGKGTGLGLSISKGIVENHNGRFEIEPDCENTCFSFTLPLAG